MVERENCEPTGRLMPYPSTEQEWEASVVCTSLMTGVEVVLSALYYPDESEFLLSTYCEDAEPGELADPDMVDWRIHHYEIDGSDHYVDATVDQAVYYAGKQHMPITARAIRAAAARGDIKGARKFGRDWLIPYASLDSFLRNRTKPGRKPVDKSAN